MFNTKPKLDHLLKEAVSGISNECKDGIAGFTTVCLINYELDIDVSNFNNWLFSIVILWFLYKSAHFYYRNRNKHF